MKILYPLVPWQIEVCNSNARFGGIFVGRRGGKSFLWKARALRICSEPRKKYWYVAPTAAQSVTEYNDWITHPQLRLLVRRKNLDPFPQIWLPNGSVIGFRTFERPDNLRGSGLAELFIDEIQNISERDFWPVLRPLISAPPGNLYIAGQFRGENWYHKQFYLRGQLGDGLYQSWRYHANVGLYYQSDEGRAELAEAKATLPIAVWEQEYECIPAANARAVFRHTDLKAAKRGTPLKGPTPGRSYLVVADLGRVKDPTSIVIIEVETMTVVHAETRPLGEKHQLGAKHLELLTRRWNALLIIDSTGGAAGGTVGQDAFIKFYRQLVPGLREFIYSHKNKERLVHHLSLAFEQFKVAVPEAFIELHKQLAQYEYSCNHWNRYEYSAPPGEHDDFVSALMMAVWAVHAGWGPRKTGLSLETLQG